MRQAQARIVKLRALPREIGKLGALKQLTLWGSNELEEMPDLSRSLPCLQQLQAAGWASGVSWLDEQALVMIADEVLGGWGLLKEWRQELVAANV